jgi:hypothetical protein
VRVGRRGPQDRWLTETACEGGATVLSSELGTMVCSIQLKADHCWQFIVPMYSRNRRARNWASPCGPGLLAALKPRERVFPLAGCHP